MNLQEFYSSDHWKYCNSYALKAAYGDEDRKHDLLVEFLVLRWDDIVRSWDKGLAPFSQYVYMSFKWNVLRDLTDKKRKKQRGTLVDEQAYNIDDYDVAAKEERIGVEYMDLLGKLPELPPDLSFILWNYAHGHTLEAIGNAIGVSRVTMTTRLKGAIDSLKRVANVEESEAE